MAHRFYIVDVFAERPYAGNPLAVVVGEEDLPDERMQRLAAETNYSETNVGGGVIPIVQGQLP